MTIQSIYTALDTERRRRIEAGSRRRTIEVKSGLEVGTCHVISLQPASRVTGVEMRRRRHPSLATSFEQAECRTIFPNPEQDVRQIHVARRGLINQRTNKSTHVIIPSKSRLGLRLPFNGCGPLLRTTRMGARRCKCSHRLIEAFQAKCREPNPSLHSVRFITGDRRQSFENVSIVARRCIGERETQVALSLGGEILALQRGPDVGRRLLRTIQPACRIGGIQMGGRRHLALAAAVKGCEGGRVVTETHQQISDIHVTCGRRPEQHAHKRRSSVAVAERHLSLGLTFISRGLLFSGRRADRCHRESAGGLFEPAESESGEADARLDIIGRIGRIRRECLQNEFAVLGCRISK